MICNQKHKHAPSAITRATLHVLPMARKLTKTGQPEDKLNQFCIIFCFKTFFSQKKNIEMTFFREFSRVQNAENAENAETGIPGPIIYWKF